MDLACPRHRPGPLAPHRNLPGERRSFHCLGQPADVPAAALFRKAFGGGLVWGNTFASERFANCSEAEAPLIRSDEV